AGYDVAEVGKTWTGDQSDIARTKHCYSHEVEPSAVAISTFPLVADRDLVCLHHVCHERVKGRPVSPTQFGARLARVTNETIDLCRPEIARRSEEHTSELQSLTNLVCRLLLEKK